MSEEQARARAPPQSREKYDIGGLFKGNQEWIAAQKERESEFFDKLGAVHNPEYMWIGCADARVPANEIMNMDAGTVFVARNVANMVVESDTNLMSALQYAVQFLKVKQILVVGHYDCGGIRASMNPTILPPPLGKWIANVKKVYKHHQEELQVIEDLEERHRKMVEFNVIEQAWNVLQTKFVKEQQAQHADDPDQMVQVHALVFDPKDGILRNLDTGLLDERLEAWCHEIDEEVSRVNVP